MWQMLMGTYLITILPLFLAYGTSAGGWAALEGPVFKGKAGPVSSPDFLDLGTHTCKSYIA